MFHCQYTVFRQFTVVLAKVMNCYNDKIQYSGVLLKYSIVVCCYGKMLVNVAVYVITG